MKHSGENAVMNAILLAWAIFFFLYATLGAWLSIGRDALAGPATVMDTILAGLWFSLGLGQLLVAISLYRHYRLWLYRVAVILTVLTLGVVLVLPFVYFMLASS